jgi:hypothetical protein
MHRAAVRRPGVLRTLWLLLVAAALPTHAAVTTPSTTVPLQFTADRASLVLGGVTTLRWRAQAGFACVASGAWSGARPLTGAAATAPMLAARTYVLTCTRQATVVRRAVTVAVDPPTVNLAVSVGSIAEGDPVTLRWSSRSATACVASGGWTGARPGSGTELVVGTRAPTTFTLTCKGSSARVAADSTRVLVRPTASVSVSATRVVSGATVAIRWRGTTGSTCEASGSDPLFRGRVATSGVRTSSPVTASRSYSLRCTNELGSALSSTSVSPGVRRVRWRAPTKATDGRTIVGVQGYRVHAGRTPDTLVPIADVPATATSDDVALASGTWHLSVSVLARVRVESGAIAVRESDLSRPFLHVRMP